MSLVHYYDRRGKPLETLEWAALLENRSYSRVANDPVPGKPGLQVSTVWVGLDHRMPPERIDGESPLIFETLAFENGDPADGPFRSATLAAAMRTHAELLAELTG